MVVRDNFAKELENMHDSLLKMGSMVEKTIASAIKALAEQDACSAKKLVDNDIIIDELELEIEKKCLKMLALQQPMAIDLRLIATGLKIVTDLERVADHAVDIAKIVVRMKDYPLFTKLVKIPRMAQIAQEMLRDALDSYVNRDIELARRMCERDDEIDGIYSSLYEELLHYVEEEPSLVRPATYLLFVGHYLERVADHATNIGEWVIYLVTGEKLELND